ncbi:hypothetical protein LMG19087_00940 [Ralstonia wenshanensis]|nr:hypothetical protein LMG19087_00940 [Ralstonia wenshanensis]
MPVYSNARCCARVHREHTHAPRAHSISSCAPTCEQRDARRKKRCVDATARTNFSRSTRRYARNRCARHMRIDMLNVSMTLLTRISNTVDTRRAMSMRLRWSTACMQVPQIACRAFDARRVSERVDASMHTCARIASTHAMLVSMRTTWPPGRDDAELRASTTVRSRHALRKTDRRSRENPAQQPLKSSRNCV